MQNLTTPGGSVETGPTQLTLRVQGRVTSPQAIGQIVVRQVANHPIRVTDVARVEDGQEDQATVEVLDGVLRRLSDVEHSLPAGFKLRVVRDNSEVVRTAIGAVKEHLVLGALL